ncbi:hypothetical protein [Lacticaseibacillus brantae]|uniref:Lipoprotein n=1 Tax=Lacticaseibacillus brantae DSM 23927 TaxID=1423727 RepID=A0A0R2B1B9_9LACO|nr:hypothetical protein [Lacticaseibacillus brantae]KRM73095.1 hypothetical protein FC34_GL000817 [Lacticaseibacillus brantae DSM 23927]
MKRILLFITLAVALVGCSAGESQQKQVNTTASDVITATKAASSALTTINETTTSLPSEFQRATEKSATPLTADSKPIKPLLAKREQAYQRLIDIQSQLNQAAGTLSKAKNQANGQLPQTELTTLLASLKLIQLDHKTLLSYYDEVTTAETTLFDGVKAEDDSKTINSDLVALNQYASTLGQQIDISLANLDAAAANAKKLTKAIANSTDQ